MAADDKESDERRQPRSLERDRGKCRRRPRSASPSPKKQRRKRSRSPGAEEMHRHKNSAERHEVITKGYHLSKRNTEGMSEEDSGREVARKSGVEEDEKAGAGKSSKGDQKVDLHSSGDSSEDAYSDSESDRGRKKKSRSKNHKSQKSKSKRLLHVHSESEQDESQTEGTSGESSEDSEDEYRRAKRRKRLKRKEKAERERRKRKKEKKRKLKEKEREQEKRRRKKEKVEEAAKGTITQSWGKYGIITELDVRTRRPEFSAWLAEVKKVNLETLTNREEKDMLKQYMEDYNKANFPSPKKLTKQRSKGVEDKLNKESERTQFKDEEQRRQELKAERVKVEETGMGKAVRDQAVLREDMQYHCRLGNTEVCNEEDGGDCLEGDNMHGESSNDNPILDPKHKIFLSHSGAQKEFVDHLCKALEDRLHYPFFDRRHESLPKGERFSELIVQATEQCQMLIVVVSNEYFMSKWPMIELSAFVKAHDLHSKSNIGPKILPLFYGLCVSDLDNEGMQKKWFKKWETLAQIDPKKRINVSDWKDAFHALKAFNGLSYDMKSKEVVAYEDKIVSYVCNSIAPDIKWDDSHVQGKSNICKVIDEKIKGLGPLQRYQVRVLGMYGVGGIGKTTTCKILCNELSSKYEGRVCHIEFPSVPPFESKKLFQKVVRDLTRISMEVIQPLDEGQCKDVLQKNLFYQRTFLAIDNISDSHQSILEAKTLLEVPYHKDSLVLVTARSQSVLERLEIDKDACFEMPDLGEAGAINLFLHHAAGGKHFFGVQENHDIMTCIKRCYFSNGNGRDHHYHPLALQALGLQLGFYGKNPCEWVKKLSEVKSFNGFLHENPVFDILRGSFDMLSREDQTLFMDMGFFAILDFRDGFSCIKWLCITHKQDEGALLLRVERLKRQGLVHDVDLDNGRISMHDLYLEFAKLEASGFFNKSPNLSKQMWEYVENGDLANLERNGLEELKRLCIGHPFVDFKEPKVCGWIEGLEGLKWECFSHLEVLILSRVHFGHGALNLEGMIQLRVLQLNNIYEIDGVGGLAKLKHLNVFRWRCDFRYIHKCGGAHILGQFPSSLKHLIIHEVRVVVGSDVLTQCNNLFELELHGVEVNSLDLSKCSSLQSVVLLEIGKLQTLLIGNACLPSRLQDLFIGLCSDLVDILGIDHLTNLKKLDIEYCLKWEVASLLALTKLQVLTIFNQHATIRSAKDCFPCQLQELRWQASPIVEGLNLVGYNELEVLDLISTKRLISLKDLGDLPALRHLCLKNCEDLLRLPNLSLSRSLKELNLVGCTALELHEEDIEMLCELPMLEPVRFTTLLRFNECRLDFSRRKVLILTSKSSIRLTWDLWKESTWEEYDLGLPPLKSGRCVTLDQIETKMLPTTYY